MRKAVFYSKTGAVVWECTKDALYYFNNGSKAMQKGAVRAILYDAQGAELSEMYYHHH